MLGASGISLKNRLATSEVMVKLDLIEINDMFTAEGRNDAANVIKTLKIGDLIDFALLVVDKAIDTTTWVDLESEIYYNSIDLTIGDLANIANGTADAEALTKKILGDLTIADIVYCVEFRFFVAVKDELKALEVYKRVANIELDDIIFSTSGVLNMLAVTTFSELVEAGFVIASAEYKTGTEALAEEILGFSIQTLIDNIKNGTIATLAIDRIDEVSVGDIYAAICDYVTLGDDVDYYVGLFDGIVFYNLFTDSTALYPDNIFGSITLGQLLGKIMNWSKDAHGDYVAPDGFFSGLEDKVVASLINKYLAFVAPQYRLAVIAAGAALGALLSTVTTDSAKTWLEGLINYSLGDIKEDIEKRFGYGLPANMEDLFALIADANPWTLFLIIIGDQSTTGSIYKDIMVELFDHSTLGELFEAVLKTANITIADRTLVDYYLGLFGSVEIADMLTDPSPDTLFGDIKLGDLLPADVADALGWSKSGSNWVTSKGYFFDKYADSTMVALLNNLNVHDYVKTAIFFGIVAAGAGLVLVYNYYLQDDVEYILQNKLSDSLTKYGIQDILDNNIGNAVVKTVDDVLKLYADLIPDEFMKLTSTRAILEELLDGWTVAFITGLLENFDLITMVVDMLVDNNIPVQLSSLLGKFSAVSIYDVIYSISIGGDVLKLFVADMTFAELLDLVKLGDNYYYYDGVRLFSVNAWAEMSIYSFVYNLANGNITKVFTSAVTIKMLYQLIDPKIELPTQYLTDTTLDITLKLLTDNAGYWTIGGIAKAINDGKIFEYIFVDDTVEDWIGSTGVYPVDFSQSELLQTLYNNIKAVKIGTLLNQLLVEGIFDLNTILGGLQIGTLMGYYYDSVEDKWYADDTKAAELTGITKLIADKVVIDIIDAIASGGSIENILLAGAYVGDLMSMYYGVYDGTTFTPYNRSVVTNGNWYNKTSTGYNKCDTLTATIADIAVTDLLSGMDINSIVDDLYIGSLMNKYYGVVTAGVFTEIDDIEADRALTNPLGTWYTLTSGVYAVEKDLVVLNVCNMQVSDIRGNIEIADFLNGIYVGQLMNHKFGTLAGGLFTEGNPAAPAAAEKWYSYNSVTDTYAELDGIMQNLCDKLATALINGFDYEDLFDGVYTGSLIGNYYGYMLAGSFVEITDIAGDLALANPVGSWYVLEAGVYTECDAIMNQLGKLLVSDLLDGVDTDDILTGIYVGQMMKKKFGTLVGGVFTEGDPTAPLASDMWYDYDSVTDTYSKLDEIMQNLCSELVTNLINNFDYEDLFDGMYTGSLMKKHYGKIVSGVFVEIPDIATDLASATPEGCWFTLASGVYTKCDATTNKLCNVLVDDLLNNFDLKTILGDLKAGEMFGKTKKADGFWYNSDDTKCSAVEQKIMDQKITDLMDDFDIKAILGDLKAGEMFGKTKKADGFWYNSDDTKCSALEQKILEQKITDLMDDFDIKNILGDLKAGEMFGKTKKADGFWYNSDDTKCDAMEQKIFEQKVSDLMDGFDLSAILTGVYAGSVLGYKYGKMVSGVFVEIADIAADRALLSPEGTWYNYDEALDTYDVCDRILQNLNNRLMTDLMSGLDMNSLLVGVYVGDVALLTFGTLSGTEVIEGDPAAPSATDKWYVLSGGIYTEASGILNKFSSKLVTEVANDIDTMVNDLTLEDVFGAYDAATTPAALKLLNKADPLNPGKTYYETTTIGTLSSVMTTIIQTSTIGDLMTAGLIDASSISSSDISAINTYIDSFYNPAHVGNEMDHIDDQPLNELIPNMIKLMSGILALLP
ncbi:MAG: hypothetical protein PHX51_04860 [Clostridia bacterium]|nr:hypothetical protein [Clostridia bacterium]